MSYDFDKSQKTVAKGPDKAGKALEGFLQESLMVIGFGFSAYLRSFYQRPLTSLFLTALLILLCSFIVFKAWHLHFLHWMDPDLLSVERLNKLYRFNFFQHAASLFTLFGGVIVMILGFRLRYIRTKYEKIFQSIGIENHLKETPIFLGRHDLGDGKTRYDFNSKNIPISLFKSKKEALEAAFAKHVDEVTFGRNQKYISIIFTKEKLTNFVSMHDFKEKLRLPRASFYIGQSNKGIVIQSIEDLPHAYFAGTTGSGKSVSLKGVLMSLLESCPHLQLYFLDLKKGLEGVDFEEAPNVKVIKEMDEAVDLLRRAKKEMDSRFSYLEKKKRKKIVPGEDPFDRIVIAIDESSVLHMKRDRHDPDYGKAIEARTLLDQIAKLSRAAAIHLLLATQKVDKEVIPTTVQENISGRMAFKANTLQGSLVVLGSKDALELPNVPGRAVWKVGNTLTVVQTPFVSPEDVRGCAQSIRDDFEAGRRRLLNPLINEPTQKKTRNVEIVSDVVQKESA